jgi:putative DNA primase/helicase
MDNVDTALQGGVVPVRPDPAVDVDAIPAVLREWSQWVCWKYISRDGKETKCPVRASDGGPASSTDPSTWATFEDAVSAWQANGYAGIGLVFAASDPFCGIDLDDCIDDAGVVVPAAREVIESFGSYCEVSPSGRGVKIFIVGRKPEWAASRSKVIRGFKETEVYDHGRFFTVTGQRVPEAPAEVHDGQAALEAMCLRLWPQNQRPQQTRRAACGGFNGDDDLLIAKACAAKNGEQFRQLWQGVMSGYGNNHSVADLALCCHLAFWTGRDVDRMDRLYRRSGLMRDKWDERRGERTYGEITMAKAIKGCVNTYTPAGAGPGGFDADSHWNAVPLPQGYELTDLGNAERFAAAAREELRFCHGLGWLAWDGTRWGEDQRGRVITLAGQVVRAMAREAMELGDPDKAQKLRAWSKTSESRAKLESMVKLAEAQSPLAVTTADLDQGGMLLNTQTGTIDLRTGDCRLHQPSDLLTMIARTGYDPDATCPRFDEFLLQIFEGDVELIEYVMRILSMCLTGDIREQLLPIFHGPGANGKSVLIDTVLHVMGDYAGLAPPHLLEQRQHQEHPTELADLRGKRLVVASELDDDAKLKLSLVKRLTGDHTIKGRKMRQDYIEFARTHKIILVTNNLPTFSEQTEAVWRRVRVIPFNYVVPEDRRDAKLLETLKAEAPGILNRLLQACRDWLRDGLGQSSAVELATGVYRSEQDTIGWYVDRFCEVDPKAFTPWEQVWSHYETCCREQGAEPLTKAEFQMALTRAGLGTVTQKVDGHSRKGRRIRLKS